MNTVVNKQPFLRSDRKFPEELERLSLEVDRMYVDVTNSVNERTIGIYPVSSSAITGNSWFITSRKQNTIRNVYRISGEGSYAHGIDTNWAFAFVQLYGMFTDGTNWYNLPYVDVTDVTNQINIVVGESDIIITSGSGTPPTITDGYVVLEWLAPE